MAGKIFNQFTLPNTRETMITSLREILDFINNYLPAHAVAKEINFKIDIIITELLTNALKHVKNAETFMRIYIDDDNLTIEKTDFGTPFNPNNFAEIFNQPNGYKVQLTTDDLHCVYAVVERDNTIRFVCEEKSDNGASLLNDITEHFGLLIITKSSAEFTYHFDSSCGLNQFNVRLQLR